MVLFEQIRRPVVIIAALILTTTVILIVAVFRYKQQELKIFTAELPSIITVNVDSSDSKPISKQIWGVNYMLMAAGVTGLNSHLNSINLAKNQQLGISNFRYIGGCSSGLDPKPITVDGRKAVKMNYRFGTTTYNQYAMPLDEAGNFFRSINPTSSFFYQANLDAPDKPDPCGYFPLYSGTVADLNYVLDNYGNLLEGIELGNEPWGSWNVNDYLARAKEFALQIRSKNPAIKIGLVGYPTSGNNMDQTSRSPDDETWTNAVKDAIGKTECGTDAGLFKCYDYVTDHPYFFHGYSDPGIWPLPSSLKIPDTTVSSSLPSYQMLFFSYLADAGEGVSDTNYWSSCPVNYQMSGVEGLECSSLTQTSIRGIPGGAKYRGVGEYIYFKDGVEKLDQTFINDTGNSWWYQTCDLDANIYPGWKNCSDWRSGPVIINGSPGVVTDYDGMVFFDKNNHQKIRERYALGGTTYYEWVCDFYNGEYKKPDGNPADCLSANPQYTTKTLKDINNNDIAVKGIESTVYRAASEIKGSEIRQFVSERYLGADGKTLYYRDCYVDANDAINCSDSSVTQLRAMSLDKLRGTGGETYTALGGFTPYYNNSNSDRFPYNIPGVAAYYAAQEGGGMMDRRIADYGSTNLALTEWNLKNWGTHTSLTSLSVGTVDHGFYVAEMLLQMTKKGVYAANLHNYAALTGYEGLFKTQSAGAAEFNPVGDAFSLTSVVKDGDGISFSTSNTGAPDIESPSNIFCPGAGCLKGGYSVSKFSSYAIYSPNKTRLYLFLINRGNQEAEVDIKNVPGYNKFVTKTLSGGAFTNTSFDVSLSPEETYSDQTTIGLPPVSIVRVELF